MEIGQVEKIGKEIFESLSESDSLENLDQVRLRYLGRKDGVITQLAKNLKTFDIDQKRLIGPLVNNLRSLIEEFVKEFKRGGRISAIEVLLSAVKLEEGKSLLFEKFEVSVDSLTDSRSENESKKFIDLTIPGKKIPIGHKHPLVQTTEELIEILTRLGYSVAEGPEAELDYFNFEALNIPKDHPARDMQDTFYISEEVLLRTHTSPVQIRVMKSQEPPVKVIAPGKVFRCDADVTHSPMFHQIEGLYVDKNVTFSDLKGTIETFISEIFGPEFRVRLRPSFFPFTEPSAEIDISCDHLANGNWMEVLGAGMIDPAVFEAVGYDPEEWSGFAWGLGVERITMLRYGISDIRLFFENDLRTIRQF
ncbi:MAG: phenylalanine--tRNA ligase subunit alpha [Nitrospinota bacterium]|nr:phenylalanine--tRNA ligase subunit alpha [Nitrospinota bacterium]